MAIGSTGVVQTYTMFAAQYEGPIRQGAEAAMRSGISQVRAIMPALLVPFVVGVALLGWRGVLTTDRIVSITIKLCIFLWLIVSAAYIPYVWTLAVDDVPTWIATAVNGGGRTVNAIQQFDAVSAEAGAFTATALGQATCFTCMGDRNAIYFARGSQNLMLSLIFAVFFAMRMLGYILVAGGVFLMPFLLYDNTRGYVMELAGKIVGLWVWQLMTAILVRIMLTGMQTYVSTVRMNAGMSLPEMIDMLFQIASWFLLCFILTIMVPAVAAIGSHVGATSAIAHSAVVGGSMRAARMATGGGMAAGGAVAKALRGMNRKTA